LTMRPTFLPKQTNQQPSVIVIVWKPRFDYFCFGILLVSYLVLVPGRKPYSHIFTPETLLTFSLMFQLAVASSNIGKIMYILVPVPGREIGLLLLPFTVGHLLQERERKLRPNPRHIFSIRERTNNTINMVI
jgi:hypothetical protein